MTKQLGKGPFHMGLLVFAQFDQVLAKLCIELSLAPKPTQKNKSYEEYAIWYQNYENVNKMILEFVHTC